MTWNDTILQKLAEWQPAANARQTLAAEEGCKGRTRGGEEPSGELHSGRDHPNPGPPAGGQVDAETHARDLSRRGYPVKAARKEGPPPKGRGSFRPGNAVVQHPGLAAWANDIGPLAPIHGTFQPSSLLTT